VNTDGQVQPPTGQGLGASVADVAAAAAACRALVLEREGIAMFVALQDVRPGRELRVVDDAALAEGSQLAGLLDAYASALAQLPPGPSLGEALTGGGAPDARPGVQWDPLLDHDQDEAEVIDALVVLSYQHLRARLP